ncbi:MAG: 50S ribosomal protein L24 [Methylotenera sp.]|nr:50S ribosomal protein L24 [Oligoflexia bacterium]
MAAVEKKKFKLKKGDLVTVIAGKDKGKQGKIIEIVAKDDRVMVEGVNLVTRHTKPSQQSPQGGTIQKTLPIHYSNVMLVDPKNGKPTRIGKKEVNGKFVRLAKSSGQVLA